MDDNDRQAGKWYRVRSTEYLGQGTNWTGQTHDLLTASLLISPRRPTRAAVLVRKCRCRLSTTLIARCPFLYTSVMSRLPTTPAAEGGQGEGRSGPSINSCILGLLFSSAGSRPPFHVVSPPCLT